MAERNARALSLALRSAAGFTIVADAQGGYVSYVAPGMDMKLHVWPVCVLCFCGFALAQPALVETTEFPSLAPGPEAVYSGSGCFLLAQGSVVPGDVDWVRLRIPRVSTRTLIDIDFPGTSSGSALLVMVRNGTTGFNVADNNNTRDALCGLHATSSPVGSLRDSVTDLRNTPLKAVIDIAITGAADTNFIGLHNESFVYEVWAYAQTVPCLDDLGCDDAVACTVDQCEVASGDCTNTAADSLCDDETFCTGVETCDAEFGCVSSAPPSCDDQVDCTDDFCDVLMDACLHDPFDELCDNGLFCDGNEFCDVSNGCRPGLSPDCGDGVDCTLDTCDENTWECVHTLDVSACDDGLFCNGEETCDFDAGCLAGAFPCPGQMCRESDSRCVECLADVDCDDAAFCNGPESCDAEGRCQDGSPPCGLGLCREADDQCVQCLQDADCDNGAFCDGAEFCDAAGQCNAGAGPCGNMLCRESDAQCVDCLADSDCADGQFCNGDEFCTSQGACETGAPACGAGLCRESDDQCVECLTNDDCDDSLFCNGVELCQGDGQCAAGAGPCMAGQTCDETTEQCVQSSFTANVMPGVCPARVTMLSRNYLPIAISGVDVRQIDVNSVQLSRVDGVGNAVGAANGPPDQAPQFRDVTGPRAACSCPDAVPDGAEDLVVSFKVDKTVKSLRLDGLPSGTTVEVKVTGRLLGGATFSATDCVTLQALATRPGAID